MTSLTEVATAWLEAWNAHDMDAIMSHYDDEIEFYSPIIVRINNDPAGRIKGKAALRSYFERALAAYPELHFELYHILEGINSLVLYYKSVNNSLSAEMMVLNEKGLIAQVRAHYKPMS
ncbi:nuclear transport factor 2 family protein [Chitinophaga sp. Hz27]|uniref:nuclear transport factor 2 family protein n=1 Tax=Chitinophaga sp. Hz27 TaxID=3347169 RepID=UPI0035DD2097